MPSRIRVCSIEQAIIGDIGVAYRLQARDARICLAITEKMREAALQLQIVLHRNLAADLADLCDLAVLGLKYRIETAFDGKPSKPDRVMRGADPQPSGQAR